MPTEGNPLKNVDEPEISKGSETRDSVARKRDFPQMAHREQLKPPDDDINGSESDSILTLDAKVRTVDVPIEVVGYATSTYSVQQKMPEMDEPVRLRYIGALFKTYLLFEAGERLLMVDQHAAHERVLYDRYMARYQSSNASQRLLSPQLIRLTARDVTMLSELTDVLWDAGIELEAFDPTSVAVRAVPIILGESEPVRDLLLYVLDEMQTRHGKVTRERLRGRVAQMACKHAIKAGDALSDEDVKGLLVQMLSTGAQPTCPHGRPIVTEITRRELEKRFKRIQ